MRILYDSKAAQYKTPFGTLRTGENCVLHIAVPLSSGATGVRLVLENCDGAPVGDYPFAPEKQEEDYVLYRCELSLAERGLYYYWFYVTKSEGGFRLFKQGDGTNMEAGEKWQLSVIPADFTVPEYARGAVMYQIMPDRFCKRGECDLTDKLRPFTIHQSWEDTPEYRPDENGTVWNKDFFGGNFNGIREKLPYLQQLGVGMLYLNPVFMAYSNHRYDTADYKRPDPMLGTEQDFRDLCDEAHRRGIRVILDGVFSHTGSNSVYFDAEGVFGGGAVSDPDSPYRKWYRFSHYPDQYEAWWGIRTLPCVEELEESYLNYIIDDEDSVVAHWMALGADGFRLDVVDELPDEFVLRLKRRIRKINPEALLLGEVWEDASNKRAYSVSRRYFVDAELDSVMNYPWRTAIMNYVMGTDDGQAFGEAVMTIAENYPPQVLACVMNHLGTHDTPRILTLLGDSFYGPKEEKAERFLTPEARALAVLRLKRAAFLQFTLPGMPSIYYGDEAGMEGFEDPFCRRCFPWGAEDKDLQAYYAALCRMKNTLAVLKNGNVRMTEAGGGRIAFTRSDGNTTAKIYVNQSEMAWRVEDGSLAFGCATDFDGTAYTLHKNGFCLLLTKR